jgi:hypothetical protein
VSTKRTGRERKKSFLVTIPKYYLVIIEARNESEAMDMAMELDDCDFETEWGDIQVEEQPL